MSFFDDADDEPRRTTRRTVRRASSNRSGGDPQAIRRRQIAALVAGLLVLLLLILGIRSCTKSAAKRGLRDYAREVSVIGRKSQSDVSRPLFSLLSGAGGGAPGRAVEVQNQINNLKVEADDELKRAEELDVPDKMIEAQRHVLLALEFRRDGVARTAQLIQPALGGTDGGRSVRQIAGQMRAFDASDVIWSQRVVPLVRQGLQKEDIDVGENGTQVASSTFLPGGWLSEQLVADRLGAASTGAGGTPRPGTHGHGLIAVSAGQTTLSSGAVNRVPSSPTPIFMVKVQNQGENDETRVRVRVRLTGGGAPINVTKTLPSTTKGGEATASVPLARKPSIGAVLTLRAEVLPVPGEQKTDNNSQTFQVLFTR